MHTHTHAYSYKCTSIQLFQCIPLHLYCTHFSACCCMIFIFLIKLNKLGMLVFLLRLAVKIFFMALLACIVFPLRIWILILFTQQSVIKERKHLFYSKMQKVKPVKFSTLFL